MLGMCLKAWPGNCGWNEFVRPPCEPNEGPTRNGSKGGRAPMLVPYRNPLEMGTLCDSPLSDETETWTLTSVGRGVGGGTGVTKGWGARKKSLKLLL